MIPLKKNLQERAIKHSGIRNLFTLFAIIYYLPDLAQI